MTPENMPAPPDHAGPAPALRPPDFLLPQIERGSARAAGEPEIYVSWGGQIYGPSAVDDVLSGVRTAYFGEEAMFWFEGQDEWRPVEELRECLQERNAGLPVAATRHAPPPEPIRPRWPGSRSAAASTGERRRRRRKGGSSRSARRGLAGRLIVIGAVLLAIAITAGLLLLISIA